MVVLSYHKFNNQQTQQNFRVPEQCAGCGAKPAHSKRSDCPMINAECRFCKRQGHIEKMCYNKKRAVEGLCRHKNNALSGGPNPMIKLNETYEKLAKELIRLVGYCVVVVVTRRPSYRCFFFPNWLWLFSNGRCRYRAKVAKEIPAFQSSPSGNTHAKKGNEIIGL